MKNTNLEKQFPIFLPEEATYYRRFGAEAILILGDSNDP